MDICASARTHFRFPRYEDVDESSAGQIAAIREGQNHVAGQVPLNRRRVHVDDDSRMVAMGRGDINEGRSGN